MRTDSVYIGGKPVREYLAGLTSCTGNTPHYVSYRVFDRTVTARHGIISDPYTILPCVDYVVTDDDGRAIGYVVAGYDETGSGPYQVFGADMRYLDTRQFLPEAVIRAWLSA